MANNATLRSNGKHITSHVIGYALPAVFVLACMISDLGVSPGSMAYGQGSFCWIGSDKSLLTTFIIPSGILVFVNVFTFLGCCLLLFLFYAKNRLVSALSLANRRSFMVLFKLLIGSGIQWLFGVLSHFYPHDEIVLFIFILLVSIHGILVLVCTLFLRVVRRKIAQMVMSVYRGFRSLL